MLDETDLLKLLVGLYYEISGEILEPTCNFKHNGDTEVPQLEVTQATKMAARPNKSKHALIVIEAIDYYLYDTSSGFDRMTAVTRAVGCLLGKLARLYAIPTIVTASVHQSKDYSKYNLSPWLNFTADSVFLSKCYTRSPDDPVDRKQVFKPLVLSKKAPFFIDRSELPTKEYRLRFKAHILCLEHCGESLSSDEFFTEKTFKNA